MDSLGKVEIWLKNNRTWLGYLFVLSLLSFPYELFNFTLTIDEELHAGYDLGGEEIQWVAQGRWSMYLLSYLFPPIITVELKLKKTI